MFLFCFANGVVFLARLENPQVMLQKVIFWTQAWLNIFDV